jgi:hypothetical protein
VNARITRQGDLDTMEIRGDMDLRINDSAYGKVALRLAQIPPNLGSAEPPVQFQQHPNVKKFTAAMGDKIIALKDPARSFPIGQGLGVLRWKLNTKDETFIPLNGLSCPLFL